MVKKKSIPLSEPMGGESSCCIHSEQCRDFVESIRNQQITFRCPLMVVVDDNVEYAGEWHESCTFVAKDA